MRHRILIVAALTAVLAVASVAMAAGGQDEAVVAFDRPRAGGAFGEPITFTTTFSSPAAPRRVELITSAPDADEQIVALAGFEPIGPDRWRATHVRGGHIVPNTRIDFAFRAVLPDGVVEGPTASHTIADDRLEWERISGDHVTVWWHAGDEAFARRALTIAERAVDDAGSLLGVETIEPVDFIIYSDGRAFRQAMGPATRENVGGQAHPDIRTLFGLITPVQIRSDWVEELVVHELAHLVFDAAVHNPYTFPPRWLNEGLAVYLSTGYTDADRRRVDGAAGAGSLIPLDGLAGRFPTQPRRFGLAYAESVSAVDHLVDRFGEDVLVEIITSFGEGRSLDEAFVAATGIDVEAFEASWLDSLGATRPEPFGPRPAPPGPVPDAWESTPDPLLP